MIQQKKTRHRAEGVMAGLRRGFVGLLLMIVIIGFVFMIFDLSR